MHAFYIPLDNALRGVLLRFSSQPCIEAYLEWENGDTQKLERDSLVSIQPYGTTFSTWEFYYILKANTQEQAAGTVKDSSAVRLLVIANELPYIYADGSVFNASGSNFITGYGSALHISQQDRKQNRNVRFYSDVNGVYIGRLSNSQSALFVGRKFAWYADNNTTFHAGFSFHLGGSAGIDGNTSYGADIYSGNSNNPIGRVNVNVATRQVSFYAGGSFGTSVLTATIPTPTDPLQEDNWTVSIEKLDDQFGTADDGWYGHIYPTNGQAISGLNLGATANINDSVLGLTSGATGVVEAIGGANLIYVRRTSSTHFETNENIVSPAPWGPISITDAYTPATAQIATEDITWGQWYGFDLFTSLSHTGTVGSERLNGWHLNTESVAQRQLTPVLVPEMGPGAGPQIIAEWDMELASGAVILAVDTNGAPIASGETVTFGGTATSTVLGTGADVRLDINVFPGWDYVAITPPVGTLTTPIVGGETAAFSGGHPGSAIRFYGVDDTQVFPLIVVGVNDLNTVVPGALNPLLVSSTGHSIPTVVFTNNAANIRYIPTSLVLEAVEIAGSGNPATNDPPNPYDPADGPVPVADSQAALAQVTITLGTDGTAATYQRDQQVGTPPPAGANTQNILASTGGVVLLANTMECHEIPIALGTVAQIEESGASDELYASIGRDLETNNPAVASSGYAAGGGSYQYSTFTVRCRLLGIPISTL